MSKIDESTDLINKMQRLAGIENTEPPARKATVEPTKPVPVSTVTHKFSEQRPTRAGYGYDSVDDAVKAMNKKAKEGWR